jgi:hypothetical protein
MPFVEMCLEEVEFQVLQATRSPLVKKTAFQNVASGISHYLVRNASLIPSACNASKYGEKRAYVVNRSICIFAKKYNSK